VDIDFNKYYKLAQDWCMQSGWKVLIILVLMYVGTRVAGPLAVRLFPRSRRERDPEYAKRAETLAVLLGYLFKVTFIVIGLVMILGEFKIEVGPILAAAGIVGVAVGFGAQHLVRDVISGFFILLDDQVRVGDVIQAADKGGLVEKINLRLVVLRDLAGNVHYIRNGDMGVITNMTRGYSRYVFEIGVSYREDVDQVIEVIKEVDEELRGDPEYGNAILEPIEILGLDKFADSAVIIKARTKTRPIKQWAVGREFNRRLKRRFDELDIQIPFPHLTLYMGRDKEGDAPPVHVAMKQE